MKTKIILLIICLGLLPHFVQAQILPACTATGNCGICDFLDTFVNIIRWLLGIIGGAALIMMIWHAFGWLISVGNKEKIDASRKGILNTLIAVFIILFSWQIVNIIIVLLVSPVGTQDVHIFGDNSKAWYQYCNESGKECVGRGDGSPCGNGNFCKNQVCTSENASSCATPPCPLVTACDYWATPSLNGGVAAYEGYICTTSDQCDPNLNLGSGYCSQSSGQPAVYCCKPKQSAAP